MDTRPLTIVPFSKGSSTYRVKRYRERAEELRTIAEDLTQPDCQQMLMRLANSYDQMANAAEQHKPHGFSLEANGVPQNSTSQLERDKAAAPPS